MKDKEKEELEKKYPFSTDIEFFEWLIEYETSLLKTLPESSVNKQIDKAISDWRRLTAKRNSDLHKQNEKSDAPWWKTPLQVVSLIGGVGIAVVVAYANAINNSGMPTVTDDTPEPSDDDMLRDGWIKKESYNPRTGHYSTRWVKKTRG